MTECQKSPQVASPPEFAAGNACPENCLNYARINHTGLGSHFRRLPSVPFEPTYARLCITRIMTECQKSPQVASPPEFAAGNACPENCLNYARINHTGLGSHFRRLPSLPFGKRRKCTVNWRNIFRG